MRGLTSMSRRAASVTLILAAMMTFGCGPSGPETADFEGHVTRNGKPVSNVLIHFLPSRGRVSSGRTDAEGKFRLSFSKDIPNGALIGKHKVYVTVPQASINEPVNLSDAQYHPEMRDILRKYGSYQTTTKEVEVTSGMRTLEIELE